MTVTVNVDFSKLAPKVKSAEKRVRTLVTLKAREDCKPYVPIISGALRETAETESIPEKGKLIWGNASVPYARAQYYGLPKKSDPNACCQWFESAKASHEKEWINIAKTAVGEVFNG